MELMFFESTRRISEILKKCFSSVDYREGEIEVEICNCGFEDWGIYMEKRIGVNLNFLGT